MDHPMVLESIVTSIDAQGQVNVAPMGPHVDRAISEIVLKPFKTSTTYSNLKKNPHAVVHVVDDVMLLAQAAVGRLVTQPKTRIERHKWSVLEKSCRWYALTVQRWIDDSVRPTALCKIEFTGTENEFFGFNRAKHAVVELAILATRVHILPATQLFEELERLSVPVDKTGGNQEREAFELLQAYIREKCDKSD